MALVRAAAGPGFLAPRLRYNASCVELNRDRMATSPFPLSLRDLASRLRAELLSEKALPALAAGFTSGLGLLVAQIAFGSFIFSGPLATHSSQGVGLVLFGNFAACLVIALAGGYRGAIAGLSPALVIVMATIGFSMDAEGHPLFVTTVAALMISAVATGVFCFLIGRFRRANLVRFIPYPVAGGFVAGIGGAVCLAAMSLMGAEPDWRALPALLQPAVLSKWSPGVAYGIALYLALKRWRHPIILPLSVVLAVAAYHLVLSALGISGAEARAAGLLLTSTADGGLWPAVLPADLAQIEWDQLGGQIPHMLTLILVAFICVVLNLAGLELATNQELDWDKEFRVTGVASTIAGLGGGTVATLVVPASLRSKLFGAATRLTGVVAAAVIGGALFLGDGMLELVPAPLVGGILVFAGLGMLDEGLVRTSRRLPWSEYGIIVLIFITITSLGLLEGVGVGMLATLVFFAVRLGSVDPIEAQFTARERESNRARPVPDRAILLEDGARVHAYRLRGYLFFGSVSPLADHLRQSLGGAARPVSLLLDFTAVSGFDFSALNVLSRFLQTAHAAGVRIVLSAASDGLRAGLERNLPAAVHAGLLLEPDADRGLERCEDLLIATWKADADNEGRRAALLEHAADDLERYLERQIRFENLMQELRSWLNPRAYSAGETLAAPGAPGDGLQLLLTGRASGYDTEGIRLYQCGPGDAIWPGALDDKATSVVADQPCRTMVLTLSALGWLEQHEERLALTLYRYLLGGRLKAATAADQPPADP